MGTKAIKIECSKCKQTYEVTLLKPNELVNRLCPECKKKINMSGATKPRKV